jgi:HPr kinase/phosphorylase
MNTRVHGTAVEIGGRAVLIVGPSGSGKSDLALRLIDRGAILIADDYVEMRLDGAIVRCSPPAAIAGRIEVRGIGIARVPFASGMPLAMVVDLGAERTRLPAPMRHTVGGVSVAAIAIDAHAASAPIKVELALSGDLAALD